MDDPDVETIEITHFSGSPNHLPDHLVELFDRNIHVTGEKIQ